MKSQKMLFKYAYREFSPNANFITADFVTAVFQNFPQIFALCEFWAIHFISAVFRAKGLFC